MSQTLWCSLHGQVKNTRVPRVANAGQQRAATETEQDRAGASWIVKGALLGAVQQRHHSISHGAANALTFCWPSALGRKHLSPSPRPPAQRTQTQEFAHVGDWEVGCKRECDNRAVCCWAERGGKRALGHHRVDRGILRVASRSNRTEHLDM